MAPRLHGGGRFRRWLGARFGGDEAVGDRALRRILHAAGASCIVYYVVPEDFFVVPKQAVLLGLLAAVLILETLRHTMGLEVPTIRPYEAHRVGSFALYALSLVIALLVFPEPVGAAVILGASIVDPIAGEIRASASYRKLGPWVPFGLYFALAWTGLAAVGGWPVADSLGLALLAALLAIAVEGVKVAWVDDDVTMVVVPGVALWAVADLGLHLTG